MNNWNRIWGLALVLTLCVPATVFPQMVSMIADDQQSNPRQSIDIEFDGRKVTIAGDQLVNLKITPRNAPIPALKHRLFPSLSSLKRGDAATLYHRAIMFLRQRRSALDVRSNRERSEKGERVPFQEQTFDELSELLPKKLSKEELMELKKVVDSQGATVFDELVLATQLRECDWGFDVNEGRPLIEYISFLLPEMQEFRGIARYLAIRAKVQIESGEFEEAIKTLRTGFKMSKATENTRFLVCSLIGVACSQIMLSEVERLVGAEDAPNLYWSLSVIPDPVVSVRQAVVYEIEFLRNGAGMSLFKDPENEELSAKQWNLRFAKEFSDLSMLGNAGMLGNRQNLQFQKLGALALLIRGYPIAKRQLIEWGFDPEKVEEMPAMQVIAIHQSRLLQIVADEILKFQNLDLNDAIPRIEDVVKKTRLYSPGSTEIGAHQELIPVASILLPAVTAVLKAENRLKRKVRLLQTIESIRIHAAETGELPSSLGDIKAVPVPRNPDTGKAFIYRQTPDGGLLWEMDPGLSQSEPTFLQSRVYRIQLRK